MEYPATVGELAESLRHGGYLADRGLSTSLLVSLSLHRPVLLEGEVGLARQRWLRYWPTSMAGR